MCAHLTPQHLQHACTHPSLCVSFSGRCTNLHFSAAECRCAYALAGPRALGAGLRRRVRRFTSPGPASPDEAVCGQRCFRHLTPPCCAQVAQSSSAGLHRTLVPLQLLLHRHLKPRKLAGWCPSGGPRAARGRGLIPRGGAAAGPPLLRAPAVAKLLVSTRRQVCQASRSRPARAPHRAPRLPPHAHRPRTRCPLLPLTLPPLPLAFGRRCLRSDGRFRACEKARPQPRPAPAPARPARAPHAAHDGGRLAPAAGHAAAAVAAARAALTRRACFARAGRFCALPGARRTRRTSSAAPTTARLPPDGGACMTHPPPPLPRPRSTQTPTSILTISSSPTPGVHPRRPPAPAPADVLKPSGVVLVYVFHVKLCVSRICTSCVFPFEISGLATRDRRSPALAAPPAADGSGATPHTSPTAIPRHPAGSIVRCGALGREEAENAPRRAMPWPSKPIAGPG